MAATSVAMYAYLRQRPLAAAGAVGLVALVLASGWRRVALVLACVATVVGSAYSTMRVIATRRAHRAGVAYSGPSTDTHLTAADRARGTAARELGEYLLIRAGVARETAGAKKAPLPNNKRSATLESKLQDMVDLFCRDYLS